MEQFEKVWVEFATQFKVESPDFFITLTTRMPELKEDYVFELTIENVIQEKEIADKKMDILDFVRKELNNYKIQLQTVITKSPEIIKPFTNKDKFTKMAEKNPAIKTLKDKFDLEIDF